MGETRVQFHEELAHLESQAMGAIDMVVGQLDRAMESVAHQDVELASFVIADDDRTHLPQGIHYLPPQVAPDLPSALVLRISEVET